MERLIEILEIYRTVLRDMIWGPIYVAYMAITDAIFGAGASDTRSRSRSQQRAGSGCLWWMYFGGGVVLVLWLLSPSDAPVGPGGFDNVPHRDLGIAFLVLIVGVLPIHYGWAWLEARAELRLPTRPQRWQPPTERVARPDAAVRDESAGSGR